MKHKTLSQQIKAKTGINVDKCYQCGKCTAGCVLAEEMEYPPSLTMRMLQTKNTETDLDLLKSETIWLCVSCQNCLSRCPMEIDIPLLMDFMRGESAKNKRTNKKSHNIVSFHKAFLDSIKHTGRLYEIGLVAGYKLRTFNLLQDVPLAPKMYAKGKLPLLPEMVKDKTHISKIFEKTKNT